MISNNKKYDDIFNYRNSGYFINTVKEARRFEEEYKKELVIFEDFISEKMNWMNL